MSQMANTYLLVESILNNIYSLVLNETFLASVVKRHSFRKVQNLHLYLTVMIWFIMWTVCVIVKQNIVFKGQM